MYHKAIHNYKVTQLIHNLWETVRKNESNYLQIVKKYLYLQVDC